MHVLHDRPGGSPREALHARSHQDLGSRPGEGLDVLGLGCLIQDFRRILYLESPSPKIMGAWVQKTIMSAVFVT